MKDQKPFLLLVNLVKHHPTCFFPIPKTAVVFSGKGNLPQQFFSAPKNRKRSQPPGGGIAGGQARACAHGLHCAEDHRSATDPIWGSNCRSPCAESQLQLGLRLVGFGFLRGMEKVSWDAFSFFLVVTRYEFFFEEWEWNVRQMGDGGWIACLLFLEKVRQLAIREERLFEEDVSNSCGISGDTWFFGAQEGKKTPALLDVFCLCMLPTLPAIGKNQGFVQRPCERHVSTDSSVSSSGPAPQQTASTKAERNKNRETSSVSPLMGGFSLEKADFFKRFPVKSKSEATCRAGDRSCAAEETDQRPNDPAGGEERWATSWGWALSWGSGCFWLKESKRNELEKKQVLRS